MEQSTESDVIQSLEIVGRRCTTLIAHRLTTRCDRIYEFNEGQIVHSGDYNFYAMSETFVLLSCSN